MPKLRTFWKKTRSLIVFQNNYLNIMDVNPLRGGLNLRQIKFWIHVLFKQSLVGPVKHSQQGSASWVFYKKFAFWMAEPFGNVIGIPWLFKWLVNHSKANYYLWLSKDRMTVWKIPKHRIIYLWLCIFQTYFMYRR